MKLLKRFLLALVIMPCALVFTGCFGGGVTISDIQKTSSNGIVDTYTITYSDGSTSEYTVTNGKDGDELYNDITINDLYNAIKDSKPDGYSLSDFINEYLDIKVDSGAVASSNALRSAVSIYTEHKISIPDYNNVTGYIQTPIGTQISYGVKNSITWGAGAGVIFKLDKERGDAYIITNYHVCFGKGVLATDGIGTKFTVYLYGGETIDLVDLSNIGKYNNNCKTNAGLFEYDSEGLPIIDYGYGAINAQYIGGSENYDIAVLKISNSDIIKNSDAKQVEVVNSDRVTAGSTAIAIGNPDASGIAVTNGVVSVDSEYIQVTIDDVSVTLREFRIDTPVNSGNSGGGLFNSFGELIGIVNAKTSDTSIENMSYAIPCNIAINIANSIIDNCDGISRKTSKVLVGITVEAVNSKGCYNEDTGLMEIKQDVRIQAIGEDSVALSIGLKVNDIIDSIDIIKGNQVIHIEVNRLFTLIDCMLNVRVGDNVRFNYTRNGISGSATTPQLVSSNFTGID